MKFRIVLLLALSLCLFSGCSAQSDNASSADADSANSYASEQSIHLLGAGEVSVDNLELPAILADASESYALAIYHCKLEDGAFDSGATKVSLSGDAEVYLTGENVTADDAVSLLGEKCSKTGSAKEESFTSFDLAIKCAVSESDLEELLDDSSTKRAGIEKKIRETALQELTVTVMTLEGSSGQSYEATFTAES